jgi:hypothetical protein
MEEGKTYTVVLPEFLAKGLEARLEILGKYFDGEVDDGLIIDGAKVNNDVRDVVIAHMLKLGKM